MPAIRINPQARHFAEVDSTNSWLLRLAHVLPSGTVVTADFQTAGRGRFGREWNADRAQSVLMSLLFHVPEGDAWIRHASWIAGSACVRAIEQAANIRVRLRWPNDLVIADRKCGGILVETASLPRTDDDVSRRRAVVIGIGINCNQSADAFPPELAKKAVSLAIVGGKSVDRVHLVNAIVDQLQTALDASDDPASLRTLRQDWLSACDDIGRATTLIRNSIEVRGIVRSIADDGDLLVEVPGGEVIRFEAATTTRLWNDETPR